MHCYDRFWWTIFWVYLWGEMRPQSAEISHFIPSNIPYHLLSELPKFLCLSPKGNLSLLHRGALKRFTQFDSRSQKSSLRFSRRLRFLISWFADYMIIDFKFHDFSIDFTTKLLVIGIKRPLPFCGHFLINSITEFSDKSDKPLKFS